MKKTISLLPNKKKDRLVMIRITEEEHSFLKKVSKDIGRPISTLAHDLMKPNIEAAFEYGYNGKPGTGKSFYKK